MRGKRREILEAATVCFICGGAPSPGNPLTVRDVNANSASLSLPGVVAMDADLTPNPQAVHRSCKPGRGPRPSVTAWGDRGWRSLL